MTASITHDALYHLFNIHDTTCERHLSVSQLHDFYSSIRFNGISHAQIKASMRRVSGSDEYVTYSDMSKLVQEMDRRYFLLQNFQWEFALLDHDHVGCISLENTRLMFEAVHGSLFSIEWWNRFLSSRQIRNAPVTFAEMEVQLCEEPSRIYGRRKKVPEYNIAELHKTIEMANKTETRDRDIGAVPVEQPEPTGDQDENDDNSIAPESAEQRTMRKHLKKAIKSREEPQLEESIKKYKTIEPTKSLDSLVKKARNLLEMLKCSKGLSSAVLSRVIADIQSAVDRIKKGGFDELSSDVASAEKLLLRLRHLERLRSEVLELKQSTIAELRSYKQPIPVIHNVMKATYMLLGVPENETKKWSSIQTLLGKTGKDGLKRRISTFKETSVTLEIARRAKHLIGQEEDLESIRDVSAGAATFYLWVTGMVEEVLHNAQ